MNQPLPLTAAQTGIWLGQKLDPENPGYWTAECVELNGTLDIALLRQAIVCAIRESDALHMRFFATDDGIWQKRFDIFELNLNVIDLSENADELRWHNAQAWMESQLQQSLNLEQDQLWRCALIRLQADQHLWFLQAHHIVLDGFGFALLIRRVAACYSALTQPAALTAKSLQPFFPVITADQQYHSSEQYQHDRQFWQSLLQHRPAPARLADLHPVSHRVSRCRQTLPLATLQRWQRSARLLQADWFCWLSAVVAIWLHDQTGRTSITLGIPVMNRLGSPALNVPCMHMNILPLPIHVDPAISFHELVQQIHHTWKQIRPHQRYRYEQLKQDLQLRHDQRLFGPVLNIMPFDRPLQFANTRAQTHPVSAGPVEDIAINILPQSDACIISLEGNADAYSTPELQRHLTDFLQRAQLCTHQDTQPINARIPHCYRKTAISGATKTDCAAEIITRRILRVAQLQPNKIAITTVDGNSISYGQLLPAVQGLAGVLVKNGIQSGDRIALLLPRAPDAVVAMLAVLWVGAAYIPLDPSGPAQRRDAVLQHAKPQLLITQSSIWPDGNSRMNSKTLSVLLLDHLSKAVPTPLPLLNPRHPDNTTPAYLIYTSGSTGTPNGVVISHVALSHFIAAASERYDIQQQDRILQFSPLHFDASVEEIFLALGNGASLVLRNDSMQNSLQEMLTRCHQHSITILDLPTAYWHELVFAMEHNELTLPASIRTVIIGGEAALPTQVHQWRKRVGHVNLINTYGPTETTVVCTSAHLSGSQAIALQHDNIPIGLPLPGIQCIVIDQHQQPVNPGETGELCILGPTLAQGYWHNAALTEQRFIHIPCLDNGRAYRTGDRVKRNNDGQLLYLGRMDDELKISGHRVAPIAIETTLSHHPNIRECAVVAATTAASIVLVAFITTEQDLTASALRQWLQPQLLPVAIPSHFIVQAQLPKNANNKIDRKALLQHWENLQHSSTTNLTSHFTQTEKTIAHLWHTILGIAPQSIHDDFFALGGKSLQAIQVVNRLNRQLKTSLPASIIFKHPGLRTLAQVFDQQTVDQQDVSTPANNPTHALSSLVELQTGEGTPLFCIHPVDGLSWCYMGLTQHLNNVPVVGIQSPGLLASNPPGFSHLIDHYLALIKSVQPRPPYRLLGWSFGGGVAHALAARLQQQGDKTEQLFLMDAYPADHWRTAEPPTRRDALLTLLDDIQLASDSNGDEKSEEEIMHCLRQPGSSLAHVDESTLHRMIDTALFNMQQYRTAQHPVYAGNVVFFLATQRNDKQPEWHSWHPYIKGNIDIIELDCNHFSMHHPHPMASIGRVIAQRLQIKAKQELA